MIRTSSLIAIALLALSSTAHAQAAKSDCGPEVWSTEKMAYTSMPCTDAPAATAPQQATAPLTDREYCMALVKRFDTYINKAGKSGGMQSTNNAANVAAMKCRSGDTSDIADLEKALKDARVELPARN